MFAGLVALVRSVELIDIFDQEKEVMGDVLPEN